MFWSEGEVAGSGRWSHWEDTELWRQRWSLTLKMFANNADHYINDCGRKSKKRQNVHQADKNRENNKDRPRKQKQLKRQDEKIETLWGHFNYLWVRVASLGVDSAKVKKSLELVGFGLHFLEILFAENLFKKLIILRPFKLTHIDREQRRAQLDKTMAGIWSCSPCACLETLISLLLNLDLCPVFISAVRSSQLAPRFMTCYVGVSSIGTRSVGRTSMLNVGP